jgi:hypothetical protein
MRRTGVAGATAFFDFLTRPRTADLATEPCPRVNPVAVCGSRRDAQDLSRLIAGEPRKETQLDQPGLDWITPGELGQSDVECEQILIGLGRGNEIRPELLPPSSPAVNSAALPPGPFGQDAPHGRCRRREAMTTPAPGCFRTVPNQPQRRFVDERRRLKRLPGLLPSKFLRGQLAQLNVDERQELRGSARIALLDRGEDARDVVHGLEPA